MADWEQEFRNRQIESWAKKHAEVGNVFDDSGENISARAQVARLQIATRGHTSRSTPLYRLAEASDTQRVSSGRTQSAAEIVQVIKQVESTQPPLNLAPLTMAGITPPQPITSPAYGLLILAGAAALVVLR